MPTTPPPDWITHAKPGDRRLLDQEEYWVAADGTVLTIAEMSTAHLANVAGLLRANATRLHMLAMADALLDLLEADAHGAITAEAMTHHLTGESIATLDADDFVQTCPLARAIHRELARRHTPPP